MAAPLLTDDELQAGLADLAGWTRDGVHLRAQFTFADFRAALAFMVMAGVEAERLNHHPEWSNVYNRVTVGLTTHDAGGLTQNDVDLAAAMSAAAARLQSS